MMRIETNWYFGRLALVYKREAHWVGANAYIAEWYLGMVAITGPDILKRIHVYAVHEIGSGRHVAIAVNDYEAPIFKLVADLRF